MIYTKHKPNMSVNMDTHLHFRYTVKKCAILTHSGSDRNK